MKIAFHVDNLSLRGTTTAILDYAKYNKKLLDNESIICYNKSLLSDDRDQNFSKRFEISQMFKSNYDVIEYDNKSQLKEELDKRSCEHVYFLKSGYIDDNYIEGKKNLIHVVFNYYQPHGHRYAYVSDWLANQSSGNKCDFVPHIVCLPEKPQKNIRKELNISDKHLVIGRYGGLDQFDIPFVYEIIDFIVKNDSSIVFLFVNTKKFINHPNVIFLDPIIDPQDKTNFILSCDAMIHARSDGESFGLSICEFLFHNKPVLSYGGGRDKNNVALLEEYGLIFNNQYELLDKLFKLKYNAYSEQFSEIVEKFSPDVVMKKFDQIFLRN